MTTQKHRALNHGEAGNTSETMRKLGQPHPHTAQDKSGPMLPKAKSQWEEYVLQDALKFHFARGIPHTLYLTDSWIGVEEEALGKQS